MKSWQVNEQVPELIKVSDFPAEPTARENLHVLKLHSMLFEFTGI